MRNRKPYLSGQVNVVPYDTSVEVVQALRWALGVEESSLGLFLGGRPGNHESAFEVAFEGCPFSLFAYIKFKPSSHTMSFFRCRVGVSYPVTLCSSESTDCSWRPCVVHRPLLMACTSP